MSLVLIKTNQIVFITTRHEIMKYINYLVPGVCFSDVPQIDINWS